MPMELLLELCQAWEHYTCPAEGFRRTLGMKIGTLRKLMVKTKSRFGERGGRGSKPRRHGKHRGAQGSETPCLT
jgi:NAD dependent epimerase/dehydratase family enzyme